MEDIKDMQFFQARKWHNGTWATITETVSPEEPLAVRYPGGETLLWAWPENLEDLCLGHVLLDCLPASEREKKWQVQEETAPEGAEKKQRLFRVHPVIPCTTECPGQKGETRWQKNSANTSDPGHLPAAELSRLMRTFLHLEGACPQIWEATGCFHRAGLFDTHTGTFVCLAEDIGRHNCLDRLAGWCARTGNAPEAYVLFVSARITASLFAKARRAGFRMIISRSAITTAPLHLSEGQDVTIVGFCRPNEERFTVFSDPKGRIQ